MTAQNLLLRKDYGDGIAGIALNRAPVNALSVGFLEDIGAELDDLASDSAVRAIVLSSQFKVFSAGIDLKEALDFSADDQIAMVTALNTTFLRLYAFPKPVVVAINGAAIAGGLFFVLTSDFRVAGPGAQFGLAEIRVGVDFPVGPMELARATLAPDALRRLMLTGMPITAPMAQTAGIVDVIEQDREVVLDRAIGAARDMAQSPPDTYAQIKRQIRQATITRIQTALVSDPPNRETGWFTRNTRAAMIRVLDGS
jgi:enoyl-CoA hydratase/carnithine racemase